MNRNDVLTDPKKLVRVELKNAGFDIDKINIPDRVYLLADDIFDEMVSRDAGEYRYPLGGKLYVFNKNDNIGFIKGHMCSPAIATQAEDLIAGGVKELIHVGYAGGLQPELVPGEIILTDGAFNDTAVARLYGYDYEIIRSSKDLTNEIEEMIISVEIPYKRGLHWTTDAGYRETWGQVMDYRDKGALCVEMEGAAIAHACFLNQVPFVILRCISDNADDSYEVTYSFNERIASEECASVVLKMLEFLD